MTLREYRELKGITQRELAMELGAKFRGVDAPLISKIEAGVVDAPLAMQVYIDGEAAKIGSDDFMPNETQQLILAWLDLNGSITREQLMRVTGKSDRDCRREISDLRRAGCRIVSSPGERGYSLCKSEADYRKLRNMYISKISSMASIVKAMDEHTDGQVKM